MAEYIEREVFLKSKREQYCEDGDRRKNSKGKMVYDIGDAPCRACSIEDILVDVEDFPAADVVEHKHGRDICDTVKGHCEFKCSVCGAWIGCVEGGTLDGGKFKFCPNCGADMRAEEGE